MDVDPVVDYILESQQNITIAATVHGEWLVARSKLINDFLSRLAGRIRRELPDWESEPGDQFFLDRYANFAIWKRQWNDRYWISLASGRDRGKCVDFGVLHNMEKFKDIPYSDELLFAMQKLHPSARRSQSNWWEAGATMRSPATDWTSPAVLWQIHSDSAFLEEVATQLIEVAKAAEPILDRLTRT